MQGEIKVMTRKWGNSIAVVIPNDVVAKQRIKENVEIKISIEKTRPQAGVLWGFAPEWKRSAQEIKDEARAGWLSDSDRKREEEWKKQAKK